MPEVDNAPQHQDERDIDFHGEGEQLAFRADTGGADGRNADGDALGGDQLAGTGSCRICGGYPCLHGRAGADGNGGIHLQFAQEDTGGGRRAGDESSHRSNEGGDEGIHRTRCRNGHVRNRSGHAAVAHDLCRCDNGDDGDDGEAQTDDGFSEDAQHIGQRDFLDESRKEGSEEDDRAGRRNPIEGVGDAPLALIDEDGGLEQDEGFIDDGNELAGKQQEDKDEQEGQPCHERLAEGDARGRLAFRHTEFLVFYRKEPHGSDDRAHGQDRACNARKLWPHGVGNDQLREGIRETGGDADGRHALECPQRAARDDHHEERAQNRENEKLQRDIGGNLRCIGAHDACKGYQGDADGAVG